MATDLMIFQDVRVSVEEYLEGVHEQAPELFPMPVVVTWRLAADAFTPPFPDAVVHITPVSGGSSEGYIDRSDKLRFDCYAPGQAALGTLNAVKALLVGEGIETPNGYLDEILVVPGRAPVEIEFQSENLNQATMVLEIIHRPIN